MNKIYFYQMKNNLAKIQNVTVVEAFCDPDQAPMWPVATGKINN